MFVVSLNSNRRSWESAKIEEEETQDAEQQGKEDAVSVSSNKSPELTKKEDKEGMFSKYFKKGKRFGWGVGFCVENDNL